MIKASHKPCSPIKATAAIYAMPGNGTAWPQTLSEAAPFTISKAGKTTIRFAKTCDPVQFDVIQGWGSTAVPPVISPLGPWHGPLLFAGDIATSYQHWGCGSTTTTSTDPCENYSARQLAVMPASVAVGEAVTVSGLGTPGTNLAIWLTSPSGAALGSVTVPVPATGQWSTEFTIPIDGEAGSWTASAQASDCQAITSVQFTVTDDEQPVDPGQPGNPGQPGTPGQPGNPEGEVLANSDELLPADAVKNVSQRVSASETQVKGAVATDSKLAWTGSNVRIPLILGFSLLMAGVLLVLRNRRSSSLA